MPWILLGAVVVLAITAALFVWRKWIAPWRQIELLIRQVGTGERPGTFLVDGAGPAQRVGLALETISMRQLEHDREAAERAAGVETIFAAMQDGLLVVDASRHITLVNKTLRNLFAPREITPGAPLLDAMRDATVDQTIAEALRSGEPTHAELTLSDAQGSSNRHLYVSAVPMKSDRGETSGAVVLFHDITELKRADQIRSDFVANVSHELRTPLAILRGYIETLLDSPKSPLDERTRILQVMERHSQRLGLLVEDLLALARLESSNPNLQWAGVDLSKLFEEVARDWEKKFGEKQLKMTIDLPPDRLIVDADEARLQEILYNLLDNAVKYSKEGGEILLKGQRRDNEVTLSVTDCGVGIGKADMPRVFERFYRVDKARSRELGGTGLGLSIVKHIAQLHGGRVEAESEVGKGTTIRVLLPVARKKS
jgi:two-component system, OmpR family, phosphate regulon sensor histidine kinase PhoR